MVIVAVISSFKIHNVQDIILICSKLYRSSEFKERRRLRENNEIMAYYKLK